MYDLYFIRYRCFLARMSLHCIRIQLLRVGRSYMAPVSCGIPLETGECSCPLSSYVDNGHAWLEFAVTKTVTIVMHDNCYFYDI